MASADVEAVREWVGSDPDATTVQATLTRHDGDAHRAALAILRQRRADVAAAPERWDIDGDGSEQQGKAATLTALDRDIARLERLTGDTSAVVSLSSAPICAPRGAR